MIRSRVGSMYRAFKKEFFTNMTTVIFKLVVMLFFTSYLFVKYVTSESSERFHIGSK